MFLAVGAKVAIQKEPEFAGHPKGLYMLFFAEMWERFSFYGMRGILVFYLTKHWLFGDGDGQGIYASYLALVYITPVLGGYLADRYIGQRKAVLFGGILLAIGHLLMAFEGVGEFVGRCGGRRSCRGEASCLVPSPRLEGGGERGGGVARRHRRIRVGRRGAGEQQEQHRPSVPRVRRPRRPRSAR